MNLKHVKSVTDQGNHFLVTHEKHGSFKVAKKALNKEDLKKVQAFCTGGQVQKFAAGGGVKPAAPLTDTTPIDPMDVPSEETGVTPRQMQAATINNSEFSSTPGANAAAQGIRPVPNIQDTDPVAPTAGDPNASAMTLAGVSPAQLGMTPASTAMVPVNPDPTGALSVAQTVAGPVVVPAAPALPSPNAIFGDINRQGGAIKTGAEITAKEELEKKAAQDEYNNQTKVRDAAFNASMSSQTADFNKLRDDVASTKINPNQMWQNMSTGNKVLAAFSMVLGGFAGGANGKNQAVEVIDKSIDQDIDAQKANLGKKQSLLSDNLRKSGDLREAEQMTRGQMMAGLQGQLSSIGAKYGGDKAKANADFLSSQLAEKSDTLKYQIATQRAMAAAGQSQQAQLAAAYDRLTKGEGTPADEAVIRASPMADKLGNLIVNTPNGRALAHREDDAKAYVKGQTEIAPLQGHIQRLQAMGKEAAGGNWTQKSRQAFESERAGALLELGKPGGLTRFTPEEKKLYEERIRNLNDPTQLRGGFNEGIAGIQSEINDKALADSNGYLMRPAQSAYKKVQ